MIRLITKEDFIDVYTKFYQRGWSFIRSKFTLNNNARTVSAFDTERNNTSHWWQVPYIQKRWNVLITGNESVDPKSYLVNKLAQSNQHLNVLSLGTGNCSNELFYAAFPEVFHSITCVDITENNLINAQKKAQENRFTNMVFKCTDVHTAVFEPQSFDLIMFHSSLHHFRNLDQLFTSKLLPALKPNGMLFINEYVGANRLQYPKEQIKAINKALDAIPLKYKKRKATNRFKNKYYGSGWLRMYMADPSEAVDAAAINPTIKKYFSIIEEKPYGGNLLMSVFKDIAYHFVDETPEKLTLMDRVFSIEDEFLKKHPSDFVFGIYQKK
nr:class I SAM-dependent methyltransferase [uncultured Flavobacterium sp.]